MTPTCAGIWSDDQIAMLRRVADFIKSMGAVPAVQLGHTGRKGGMTTPWDGYYQLPEDHPDTSESIGPTDTPYGGKRFPRGGKYASKEDFAQLVDDFARGAERALEAGFEWVEMHYAHGFLGASFLSPVANTRDDEYGGSLENRSRFLVEAFDAVRAVNASFRTSATLRAVMVSFSGAKWGIERGDDGRRDAYDATPTKAVCSAIPRTPQFPYAFDGSEID